MTFRKVTMGVIRNRKIKKNPLPPRKRKVTAIGYRLTAFWNRLLSLQVPYRGTCYVNTWYSTGVNRRSKVDDIMCSQKYFLYCLQADLQTRRVLTMIDILYIGTFATEVSTGFNVFRFNRVRFGSNHRLKYFLKYILHHVTCNKR